MTPWLARRWFLLLLAAGLTLALLRPGWLEPATERFPLKLGVALSLFLMAWSLETARLGRAFLRPGSFLWAMAISFLALPLAALGVGALLPSPGLRLGLFLMASVPCSLSSAVLWTRKAGGDEALAMVVILLTNGLAWLVTPLWLGGAGPVAVTLDTWGMMQSLAVVLVGPVMLGQAVRQIPGVAAVVTRHRAANSVAAQVVMLTIVLTGAVTASRHLREASL